MSDAGNSPRSEAGIRSTGSGFGPPANPTTVPVQPPVIYGPYTKGSGATSPSAQPPVRQQTVQPDAAQSTTPPPYAPPGQGYQPHITSATAQVGPDYARWSRRALALLVDDIPALIASAVFFTGYGFFLAALLRSTSAGLPTNGRLLMLVGGGSYVVALGWTIYNRWIRAGRTGQSLGKRLTRIALVSELTGQPVGVFHAFLRDLVHILDGLAYVGFLWPLWDEKRQTFADKLVRTIVVAAP